MLSCGIEEALKQEYLDEGIWRGIIRTQGQEIPFNFEVIREDSVTYDLNFINGEERVNIKGLAMQGDSVFIPIYIFDAGIKARLIGNKLIGTYEKYYEGKSKLTFEATYNLPFRFPPKASTKSLVTNIEGKWEVSFNNNGGTTKAIGVFKQYGDKVEGTFVTSLGDFRYLEGTVNDTTLWLSSFDGANTFLFKAQIKNPNEMKGEFWSGATLYQTWQAVKNDLAVMPRFASENLIAEGTKPFNFNLTDLNGKMVSLSDKKYKDKIKVVHMFGAWCPNSIDEVRFLADWHRQNKGLDVAILGLAFEQKDDFTYAKNRVNKMANKLNAQYEFLVAGSAEKDIAVQKFPSLKSIETFPTTIILDHNNKIREIFAGFRGPGSGTYYEEHTKMFNEIIQELLAEKNKEY
ncbi:MAG: TlpA family protein disulfide reductase [Bacteroidota bacterium]|nr:TlpA family protein disulfide reductase [Bacteroidota bacterium]